MNRAKSRFWPHSVTKKSRRLRIPVRQAPGLAFPILTKLYRICDKVLQTVKN
jgi:hypothetical protein